ncbi:MAG: hypothetical protein HQL12_03920 [Candidatus Omnitrophica bacterium]|nr:hypothetical protein [Candidatus Omnitrophota bacterium]
MRLFFAVILGMVFFSCCGRAQEDNVQTATSSLQSVLSNLKQSVGKLSVDNDRLVVRNNAMKQQVLQLQMQLGRLEAQGDLFNKELNRLKDQNPGRARQIANLEEKNLYWDNRSQKIEDSIKLIQQSLEARYQQEQKLLLQLKGMQNLPLSDVQSPESQAGTHRQKEKLMLMKMIYDSQQRQEALHKSILEFHKNTPLLPAAGALAHQQLLKEQIKGLEIEIARYPSEKPSADADQWDDAQLRQLESELKFSEQNYSQLKVLMEQMTKKVQSSRLTVGQHIEGDKLQSSLDDLNHQGTGLRADLDALRSQMVDLDKRKSRLDLMIKQMP